MVINKQRICIIKHFFLIKLFVLVTMITNVTNIVNAHDVYHSETLKIESNATIGLAYQHGWDVNFGAGDFVNGESDRSNQEYWVEGGFTSTFKLKESEFYGALAAVGAGTKDDGDLPGFNFTNDKDSAFEIEQAHLGWRNKIFDISLGRQDVLIGDGLIIADGNFDVGSNDGTYWGAPRTSYQNSAKLSINTTPVRLDLFSVTTDQDFGNNEIYGLNVEYMLGEENGILAAMYYTVSEGSFDGLEGINLRATGIKFSGLDNLTLYSEFTTQSGDTNNINYDGNQWHVEVNYAFSSVWSPSLTYRYFHADGDDLTSADNEEYIALTYGVNRSWDSWFQGEIAGEYYLFNQNQDTHMFKLGLSPHNTIGVSLIYFIHELDNTSQYFGTALPANTDSAFLDELNLFLEYYPNENLYLVAVAAYGSPNDAAEASISGTGNDEPMTVFEVFITYTF